MNFKNLLLIAGLLLTTLYSCDETEEINAPDSSSLTWADAAQLEFNTLGEESNFVYEMNQSTREEYWVNTDLTFDVNFKSQYGSIGDIAKIDIYAFIEEEVGNSKNYIGGSSGKLIKSISNPDQSFQITVSKDEVYQLFQGDFSTTRDDIIPGDLIEFKWVITGNDGSVIDTRKDCFGFNCTYGFLTELKVVDTWLGEFEATWIEMGSGTERYSYTNAAVGDTRIVNFTTGAEDGLYAVNDMAFGGAYGGPRDGVLTWDADTETLTVVFAESYYKSQWELVSVTEDVLTIKWTNNFTDLYAEFGTVELRRYDGLTWPNIATIVNYQ